MTTETYDIIKSRRSVRCFNSDNVPHKLVQLMLSAGAAAPSGRNCQPWKFCVIEDKNIMAEIKSTMSGNKFITHAACLIGVFYDRTHGYDEMKDYLAIGAAVQNILLCAHSLGVDTCWLGEEITKNR